MNEILMYGPIGEDFWEPENSITAKSIMSQLADMTGDVTVRISSGGGDVYAGIDIMNALKNYDGGEVTVIVESLAASAASFIAVGGADRVLMRASSELMIHRAWTWAEGNADEVAKTLKDLERQDTKLANIYAAKAGGTVEDWLAAMSDETWYTADEAVAAGLADEVIAEKSTAPEPAAKLARRRFKFANRAAAPPPRPVHRSGIGDETTTTPSNGQEEDTVSILNQLAKELGKKPEDVQAALSGFFNETVTVSGEVEVTYPAETAIAPTERVTVEPTIGDTSAAGDEEVPAAPQNAAMEATGLGLAFAPGTVPEAWDFTVDEATGVVTAKAPAGVEVGDVVEATVKVNDTTDVPVSFKVRSLSDDGEDEGEEPAGDVPAGAPANAVVTVPRAVWDEYMADRAKYAAQLEADKARELEAKIDGHIRDGRYSAAHRGEALAAYKADPITAERVWGALPKNKAVPVAELGHSGDMENMTTLERMRAKAAANRKNKKKETKHV